MKDDGLIHSTFLIVFILFTFLLVIVSLMSIPLRTRASSNIVTLKIKVQGNRKPFDQLKSRVDFYNAAGKVWSDENAVFTFKDGTFTSDVPLKSDFNYTDRYALFIKPDKFTGRIFCSTQLTGTQCNTPFFFFLQTGTAVDLTEHLFYAGDVSPANGKVDAGDMSNIMKQLGKVANATESATDLNSDGMTDVVDYSLALYSLSQSAADDIVQLTGAAPTGSPSPTQGTTPSATPALSATPAPTQAPSATPAPTIAPTATPAPTQAPSATPAPTAATTAKCHITPPNGYGDPFDLDAGKTSGCECEDSFFGRICSTVTCKTCPSGTCNCEIAMQMPPYTSNCTNGGSMSVNKVSSCN